MRGKVTASQLNVRVKPETGADKIGLLAKDAIVDIVGEQQNWYKITYQGQAAYVSNRYVEPLPIPDIKKGKVIANRLNVRSKPGISGTILDTLLRDTEVAILGIKDNWLKVQFAQQQGYVHGDYIEILENSEPDYGLINASKLNVRSQPNSQSSILGFLIRDTRVALLNKTGDWYEITFEGSPGFIHSDYVSIPGEQPAIGTGLAPSTLLAVTGSSLTRKVARTWNQYGGLLDTLSTQKQVEPACSVAVLCVESSGEGFSAANQNRMVIRFENHKFWKYWGKQHAEQFQKYFKLDPQNKPWLGHQWRSSPDHDWENFHGNQAKEWQVLELARSLDDTAALLSISMGAPQIMGFHYKTLGYPSVQAMFDKFNKDIQFQIKGLFDFMSPSMITDLRERDFVSFASQYNGSGQKERYGALIKEHYDAFKTIAG